MVLAKCRAMLNQEIPVQSRKRTSRITAAQLWIVNTSFAKVAHLRDI